MVGHWVLWLLPGSLVIVFSTGGKVRKSADFTYEFQTLLPLESAPPTLSMICNYDSTLLGEMHAISMREQLKQYARTYVA